MKSKLFGILIAIALFIRLLLCVTTYHSDLGAFALAGKYIVGEGKWLTFYNQIASKDEAGNLVVHRKDMVFNYQPLAYLIPSFVYLPFSSVVNKTGDLLLNRNWVASNPSPINLSLLLYKLPMILADIFILFLIRKFFKKENHKKISMLLWAFNPVAIYVSSVMGQVDIIIALFILLGLFYLKNNQPFRAIIFVALSALIKPVGLILIPIIALGYFSETKKIISSLLLIITGVGVYLFGIIPYIFSASYRHFALFAEQINKSTYASISIASGHDIPYFFILLAIVALLVWKKEISIFVGMGVALLASLVFTHFHPQWLVWIMPWLIIESIKKNDYLVYLATILCWFGVLFSFDETLHIQTFIHSKLIITDTIKKSSFYKEIIQISRAGLIGISLISLRKH